MYNNRVAHRNEFDYNLRFNLEPITGENKLYFSSETRVGWQWHDYYK